MNMASRFRKKDRIAGRRIAGESFLIPVCGRPVDMENIFVLNPLADFIWQRLDGERTLEAIVAEIVGAYEVEPEQAGADAVELIERLLANSLVEEVA
jgi:hypothetical protein